MIYVSGCLGMDARTGALADGVEAQAAKALENMATLLDGRLEDVVQCRVLLRSMDDYAAVNAVYARYFTTAPMPARAAFAVVGLPKDALVEIESVAVDRNAPSDGDAGEHAPTKAAAAVTIVAAMLAGAAIATVARSLK